jgi:arylsulfatase A-like enzyme
VLTSPAVRGAFALAEESPSLRSAYGSTPFGQGCLLARRLVERGVSLVTVNWERDDAYWDTHAKNFELLKTKLCPNFDRGLAALLDDLTQRGLLDETLIVCLGEFGRTPQINAAAGRDHWAPCNTVLLAGAGIPGGAVYGSSDRLAAYPASNPVTPQDLAATMYHLLGIDRHLTIRDAQGRPYALSTGEPVWDLL